MFLLGEEDFGLFGVAQEHLQVERLAEQLLAVLPHLQQLMPAVVQGSQALW